MDTRVNPPDGLHYDLPFAEYLRLPRVSAHGLMQIERSPMHYRHAIDTPHDPTPAQALGTLAHMAILEPDRYERCVHVAPEVDRRTKAGKAADQEFRDALADDPDAVVASQSQHDLARGMADAVRAQPYAAALLEDGAAEVSMLATDPETGTPLKSRADWVCGAHQAIVDVKTAKDACDDAFSRAAGTYRYHLQAALYQDVAALCGLGERAFVFLVVESEPPHGVALYQLEDAAMHAGRVRYQRALERYRECQKTGEWPGYPREIQPLILPKWSM